jgi:hypothetical protein
VDLNFLYLQQQAATSRADAAHSEPQRSLHQLAANGFGRHIAAHQHELGAAAACSWTAMRKAAANTK